VKGRGLFATSDIPSGEYICEYKTTSVNDRRRQKKRDQEYIANDEGCKVVEGQHNGKVCYLNKRSLKLIEILF
jgi:hypothetical protein